jgi:hypothetical protein
VSAKKNPYDVILIICEGSKSEPYYFEGLKKQYRLSNANILITSAAGSDPLNIVKLAQKELSSDHYDKIFCVFDRDGHKTFDEALKLAVNSEQGRSGRIKCITSIPCFEVWVLLHFLFIQQRISRDLPLVLVF